MSAPLVVVEDRDRVRTIRLRRPDKINALNAAMMLDIAQGVASADDGPGQGASHRRAPPARVR